VSGFVLVCTVCTGAVQDERPSAGSRWSCTAELEVLRAVVAPACLILDETDRAVTTR
jgi:hypothetical protein